MVIAFFRAVGALSEPPMRRVVALSFALAVLTFALLWLTIAAILYHAAFFDSRLLNWLVNLLGGLAVLGLTWLFFPAAVTLIMSFYLERVAAAVEAVDYPRRGPPRPQPVGEIVSITLRLTLLTLLLNLLVLPVYLLVPGINLFLFLALNGYLFGRGYFEVVALRRLDMGAARRVRRAVRLAARQSRRAGDRYRLYVAHLRGAAAPRGTSLWGAPSGASLWPHPLTRSAA
jgi:CysZ protein